jgi:hypothetical protein
LDKDHDGFLNEQELDKLSFPITSQMENAYTKGLELIKQQADKGDLEYGGATLKHTQEALKLAPKTLKEMDTNHDGNLSMEEAKKVMENIKKKSGVELDIPNFNYDKDGLDIKPPLDKEYDKEKSKSHKLEGMVASR